MICPYLLERTALSNLLFFCCIYALFIGVNPWVPLEIAAVVAGRKIIAKQRLCLYLLLVGVYARAAILFTRKNKKIASWLELLYITWVVIFMDQTECAEWGTQADNYSSTGRVCFIKLAASLCKQEVLNPFSSCLKSKASAFSCYSPEEQ
ncbi:hypothetical protein GUJ93_ZPchr0008g13428 [Zizania palustris]|uniref:Uncharacterized protein n=1 Tax=Zizania palustris TaxID=103762 RepID=A0A8J5UVK5_ZIZPA|nr:hypothetical protein GUJ93_ZPchr0008g13428 [Zizania palustris]